MRLWAQLLYGISGVCVLALETIWIRVIGLHVGGTAVASALVLVVFFVCAAGGNLAGASVSRRLNKPLVGYGVTEILTAGTAVILFLSRNLFVELLGPASASSVASLFRDALFVAAVAGLPSFLAGASFPLLSAAVVSRLEERTRHVGGAYALNLFGAAAGVVLGGIILPGAVGYRNSVLIACGVLAIQGLLAIGLGRRMAAVRQDERSLRKVGAKAPGGKTEQPGHLKILGPTIVFASGLLTIGLEVLCLIWFRQIRQPSVYALGATLFAFIIGLGAGALVAATMRRRGVTTRKGLTLALWATGVLTAVYPFVFHWLQKWSASRALPAEPVADAVRVAAVATALLLPLLLAAGAVLPLAWELVRRQDVWHGRAVGLLTALNKLGATCGAIAAPLLALPLLGLSGTIIVIGGLYLALGVALILRGDGLKWEKGCWAGVAAVAGLLCAAWTLRPSSYVPAAGERVLEIREEAGGVVATVEDQSGSRHIVLDQFYVLNGTGRSMLSQKQESWIPLTFAREPKRVLFIGMASGISANAVLDFPVTLLETAELVPGVVDAARRHFEAWSGRLFRDQRARVLEADGRRVVQARGPAAWDVIICDLLLPASEGTSALYSRDFLETALSRLSEDGLFCLWLPLYQHDAQMAGTAIRTFTEVFPCVIAVRGNFDPLQPTMALLGSRKEFDLSQAYLKASLESPGAKHAASESAVFRSADNFRLIFQGDLMGVREDFAGFEIITDDHPVFAFLGPRPPPPGQALRGNTLLEWFGRRFANAPLPSCVLGSMSVEEVRNGMQAGNYYFAAAVQGVPLPGASMEKELSRARNAEAALQRARQLAPGSSLTLEDLGR